MQRCPVKLFLLSDALVICSLEDKQAFLGFLGDTKLQTTPVIPMSCIQNCWTVPSDPPGFFLVYSPTDCPQQEHFRQYPGHKYHALEFSAGNHAQVDVWCGAFRRVLSTFRQGDRPMPKTLELDLQGKTSAAPPPRPPPATMKPASSSASPARPTAKATKPVKVQEQPAAQAAAPPSPTRPKPEAVEPAKPAPAQIEEDLLPPSITAQTVRTDRSMTMGITSVR